MSARSNSRALNWARQDIVRSKALRRLIGVSAAAMATAFAAKVVLPLPGTPVPFTLQVVCVLLAGALLGPKLGATSQAAYLAAGALGAPVFAAGGGIAYLLGPTGGYLLAFPLAAYVVGRIAGGGGVARLVLGLMVGVALIHVGGVSQLAVISGDLEQAVRFGALPFLALDVVKIALALLVALRIRPRALELF